MSCYLRVFGNNFDVDAFLAAHPIDDIEVHRKGEPMFPQSPDGSKFESTGFNITISSASQDQIDLQIKDASVFLNDAKNITLIKALVADPGFKNLGIDFGIAISNPNNYPVQYYNFPADLIKQAGILGLSLEMSMYFMDYM